jgi:hypothetical protein
VTSDVVFNSWTGAPAGAADHHGDDAEGSDPGFGDPAPSSADAAAEPTAADAVVMPDPFAALEAQAAEAPVVPAAPDVSDDGLPDPEADFYDLIL